MIGLPESLEFVELISNKIAIFFLTYRLYGLIWFLIVAADIQRNITRNINLQKRKSSLI